ncbi:MAG: choice-of-anchor B family protein [Crocinitomicaceae bacterium]
MSYFSSHFINLFASFLFFIASPYLCIGQSDLTLISQLDIGLLHDTGLNDVWGYVDEQGNEYAIVGTEDGTSIVNLGDPANPVEVFWLPGANSVWRDPSVFGDYAYISTEAEEGLTIIDLSPLPESNVLTTTIFTGDTEVSWESAHNCHVDEEGYLYVFGANFSVGGVLIYDVNTNPMDPSFVGAFNNWYVHDGVAFGDTLYLAHINDGFLSVVDISDRSNPQLLGTNTTPDSFTHNIWPSDNREVVFTTDELPDSFIAAYDITDLLNIVELDRVQSSPGADVIPHNTFVIDGYLVTSYYTDGITIHDAKYPHNLIEVAAYDTYPGQTPTSDGSWGVYPYLPSGIVLASDRTEGLFVLQPTYERASYLEGTVTNQVTSAPLSNVDIDIQGNPQEDLSNSVGFYASGMPNAGFYNVTYSKLGYESQMISTEISQGQITIQDVELIPITPFSLNINVEDIAGNPVQNAQVKLVHPFITYEGVTNGIGSEAFSLFYEGSHEIQVGKWGYITTCSNLLIDTNTNTLTFVLSAGYYDDFTFDFGWTVSGNAVTGMWERGVPNPTDNTVMNGDVDSDCGSMAYVTGNSSSFDPDYDDVDNGITILTSPSMDLTVNYVNPKILYNGDFYCNHGPGAINDTLRVMVNDGTSQEVYFFGPQGDEMVWDFQMIVIDTQWDLSNITVSFRVSDYGQNPNVTEAAIDYFRIEEVWGVEETDGLKGFSIQPNPTTGEFLILGAEVGSRFEIQSFNGTVVKNGTVQNGELAIDLNAYASGVYFISIDGIQKKIVKL